MGCCSRSSSSARSTLARASSVAIVTRSLQASGAGALPLLRDEAFPDVIVKLAEVAAERRTPSKELEKGFADLGYEFQNAATNAKLAMAVPSYVEFDIAEHCEKCPFNAFQPGRYSGF